MLVWVWINPLLFGQFCDLKRDIYRKERFSPAVKKHKIAMGFGQISVQAGLKIMAQIRTNSLLFKENLQS